MAPPPPLLLLLLLTLAGSSWAQDLLPDGPVDAVLGRNVTLKTLLVKPVYAFIVWNFYDGTEQVNIATQTATGLHANDAYKDRVSVDPVTGSLTLTAVRADDSGDYSITVITVDGTTRTAEIKLRVLGGNRHVKPPTVNLLKPSKAECRNQKDDQKKKTLVCVASEFYPDHISVSWEQNGTEVKDGVATDTAALRPEGEKYYKISSRLRVSAETWFNPGTQFRCVVKFLNGTSDINTTATVNGEPAPVRQSLTTEKYLKISQSAKLSYIVFIAKSCIYCAFVAFLLSKLQRSARKLSP